MYELKPSVIVDIAENTDYTECNNVQFYSDFAKEEDGKVWRRGYFQTGSLWR